MSGKTNKAVKRAAVILCLSAAGSLLSAAAEKLLSGRACIRSEKADGDVYIIGKKADPKAVCITNRSPVVLFQNAVKRVLNEVISVIF